TELHDAADTIAERIRAIGSGKSSSIAGGIRDSLPLAEKELELAASMGVAILCRGTPGYPPLMAPLPSAPPILYVKGTPAWSESTGPDRFALAIVGSRRCSAYGLEQADRFGGAMGLAGITVVSGGAMGIDTGAHRGALRAGGRTIAVLGCGLCHDYPPENAELFAKIAAGRGAIVSELPLQTPPSPENFPSRNRIISGLSLGVFVIEAAERSGALITARVAVEDHGREVFALAGRVDSPSSRGTLELIKSGGAALVTEPGDIIQSLETPARHLDSGTHSARYLSPSSDGSGQSKSAQAESPALFEPQIAPSDPILAALSSSMTIDQLADTTALPMQELRARLTLLELQRKVKRAGPRFDRS
ncbi:MAG: DNA-processing protein DprA, partial [Planctomycetota bacterium]